MNAWLTAGRSVSDMVWRSLLDSYRQKWVGFFCHQLSLKPIKLKSPKERGLIPENLNDWGGDLFSG